MLFVIVTCGSCKGRGESAVTESKDVVLKASTFGLMPGADNGGQDCTDSLVGEFVCNGVTFRFDGRGNVSYVNGEGTVSGSCSAVDYGERGVIVCLNVGTWVDELAYSWVGANGAFSLTDSQGTVYSFEPVVYE